MGSRRCGPINRFSRCESSLLLTDHLYREVLTRYLDSPILGQLPALTSLTGLPVLGSFHVSDVVLNCFGTVPSTISKNTLNLMSTYISFVNTHDPNNHGLAGLPNWPQWDPNGKAMFRYKESGPDIIKDDYRETQMRFINDNGDTYVI